MNNQELNKFIEEKCKKCKRNIDCKIVKNLDGKLVCTEEGE